MTDYEKIYQKDLNACGEPFIEFVEFFDQFENTKLNVLDLGCGQGRDALFVAKKGHSVYGVDISKTGINQMLNKAKKDNLKIVGEITDVLKFVPSQNYDVAIIDRLLHMFKSDIERKIVLKNISAAITKNGFVLISDVPKNKQFISDFFNSKQWSNILDKNSFTFVQKQYDNSIGMPS